MELETCTYTGVYARLYHLPEGLQQAYAPSVLCPFGYEDQDGTHQIL